MHIPESIALRLEELAKQNDVDISDLLRDMLISRAAERHTDEKQWATLADLARNAKAAGLATALTRGYRRAQPRDSEHRIC